MKYVYCLCEGRLYYGIKCPNLAVSKKYCDDKNIKYFTFSMTTRGVDVREYLFFLPTERRMLSVLREKYGPAQYLKC